VRNTKPDAYGLAKCYCDSNSYSHTDGNAYVHANGDGYTHSYPHADRYTHSNGDGYVHADSYRDCHGYVHADAYSDAKGYADAAAASNNTAAASVVRSGKWNSSCGNSRVTLASSPPVIQRSVVLRLPRASSS
jgi:hypothetical protein